MHTKSVGLCGVRWVAKLPSQCPWALFGAVLERYLEQTRFEEATRVKRCRLMEYNFVSFFWMEAMSVQTSLFQHHFCFDPVTNILICLAERVKWRIQCWIADGFWYCWLQVCLSFPQTTFWPIFSFTTILSHLFLEIISQYFLSPNIFEDLCWTDFVSTSSLNQISFRHLLSTLALAYAVRFSFIWTHYNV